MRLDWSASAEADLYEIADYYAQFDPDLPDVMLTRIEEAPLVLLDHPRLGPPVGSYDLHKWPARRTPFILLYRIVGETIEVARVVHAATDWRSLIQ